MKQNLEFVLNKHRENHNANSISDYYNVSPVIPLIDIVLSELKKRSEEKQTFAFSGLHIIPYIMASSPNWMDYFKEFHKNFFIKMTLKIQVYLQ